jgi:antitoxin (DNA-binding transcriptional repressor) of toxin-antitoxin stability system
VSIMAYTGGMKYAKIGELRDGLSRYLDQVRDGGEILVLDRDRPVARIVPAGPMSSAPAADSERLLDLERRGLVRRGKGRYPEVLKHGKPAAVRGSVLSDLRAERETGW